MTTLSTTAGPKRVTLDQIREGQVDLGKGIKLSAILNEEGRIAVINFTHPTKDGGVCTKGVPIRKRGRAWWKNSMETWSLWVEDDRTLTLSPSVWCREHDVHGVIRDGKWRNLSFPLTDLPQHKIEEKIDRAIELAEAYGGDYWGAILALADRTYYISDMSREDR